MKKLLKSLADTSGDQRGIRFYSDKLDETW